MKYFTYQALAAVVLSILFFGSAVAADKSPMDYFTEQDAENAKANAPILAATTIDELLELGALPKKYAAHYRKLPAYDQAQLVDNIKLNLNSYQAVAEKIDGDRAVVLRASTWSLNKAVEMSRIDGAWIPGNETTMWYYDQGASGSFVVTGVATAQMPDGQIELEDAADDALPMRLTLSDLLSRYLYGHAVPEVEFSLPRCLTTGSYSISDGSFMNIVAPNNWPKFDENTSGTLEVTRIEDGRFWANFEMTAILQAESFKEPDPTQAVNITGVIENASNQCPGGA